MLATSQQEEHLVGCLKVEDLRFTWLSGTPRQGGIGTITCLDDRHGLPRTSRRAAIKPRGIGSSPLRRTRGWLGCILEAGTMAFV